MVKFILTDANDEVTSTTASPPTLPQPKLPQIPFKAAQPRSLSCVNVSPISTMSRSTAAATKATTNQSTLSQHFKKVSNTKARPVSIPQPPPVQAPRKSIFDFKRRVQPPNHIQNVNVGSPNLFSSPSQKTPSPAMAAELYDLIDVINSPEFDNTDFFLNYNQNDKENNEPIPISPSLIQTPIQSKINVERHLRGNAGANGFVCAKSICKKDIPAAAAAVAEPNRLAPMQVVDHSARNKSNGKPIPKLVSSPIIASQCGFDDDTLNLVLAEQDEEIEISPPPTTTTHSTTVGLAKMNFQKPSNDDSVLRELNLNLNSKNTKNIVKDFEDDSSDDEHPGDANFQLTENHLTFFSPNGPISNGGTCATANTSPPPLPLPMLKPTLNNNNVMREAMQNIINRLPTTSSNHRAGAGVSSTSGNTNRAWQPNRPTNTSSQMQQQKTVPTKRPATTAPAMTLNHFRYVPPPQMQSKVDHPQQQQQQPPPLPKEQQLQQQKMDFFAPDPVEAKRPKLSIDYILGSTENKYAENLAK